MTLGRFAGLLRFAIGGAARRAGRTTACIVALGATVALYSATTMLTGSLLAEVRAASRHLPDLTLQRLVGGRPGLVDAEHVDAAMALPSVRRAEGRVHGFVFVPALEANIAVVGLSAHSRQTLTAGIAQGRTLAEARDGEAVLGTGVAALLGVRPGDQLTVPSPRGPRVFEVVGVTSSRSRLVDADLFAVSEHDARALLGIDDGRWADVAVTLARPEEASVVSRALVERFPDARVTERDAVRESYELTLGRRGGLVALVSLPVLLAMMLLAWERLIALGADERREIAVLKAIGWSTHDVVLSRSLESIYVGLTGSLLGHTVAYGWVYAAGAIGLADALYGWSVLRPALELVPTWSVSEALASTAIVVVPYAAIAIVPTWRAAISTALPSQSGLG